MTVRCAQCYRPVRPVAVFDIDGTLGDYHRHFARFARLYFGLMEYELEPIWNGEGNFEDFLQLTREQYREAKLAYRQGGNKRWLPIYPEVRDIFRTLYGLRCEIWIATTRPWQRLDNIDPDTREWLRREQLTIDGLLFGDDKYSQLLEAVDVGRVVAVVEDLPEQFDRAEDLGLPVIMRENHHNRATGLNRTPSGSLAACGSWVVERLEEWTIRNERIGGA